MLEYSCLKLLGVTYKMAIDVQNLKTHLIAIRDSGISRENGSKEVFKVLLGKELVQAKSTLDKLLVRSIKECFEETPLYRDMLFMAFGLLQGYEYESCGIKADGLTIGERREKYLRESNYLRTKRRPKKEEFDDMTEEEQNNAIDALRHAEVRRIETLVDFLAKQNIKGYIDELDNYINKFLDETGSIMQRPSYLEDDPLTSEENELDDRLPNSIDEYARNNGKNPDNSINACNSLEIGKDPISNPTELGGSAEVDRDDAHENKGQVKLGASTIQHLLDELCEPEQGRLFEDVASDIWEQLGLDGDFDLAKFEALLIKIIVEPYGESMDDAMRRDIGLLTFGLLRRYYHTKMGTSYGARCRYGEYLDHSNYMDLNYPQKSKFEKLKQTEQEEIWEKLCNLGNECKRRVCSRLLDLAKHGDCEIFMSSAIAELGKGWLDEEGKLKSKPLKERYTLKRFPNKKYIKKLLKSLASAMCLLIMCLLVAYSWGASDYNKDDDILNPQKVLERENRDRMGMNAKLPDTCFEDIDSNYTLPNGLDNMTLEEPE